MYSSPVKVGDDVISMNVRKYGRDEENREEYTTEGPERCRTEMDSELTLASKIRRSRASSSCQELLVSNIHGLHSSIPKHITTFDEKYVLRCLELIRNCALNTAALNLSNSLESKSKVSHDTAKLAIQCRLVAGADVTVNDNGSQSVMNILKSPLVKHFGSVDFDVNFRRTSLLDVTEPVYSDFVDSPLKLSNTLCYKPREEVTDVDHSYGVSAPGHKRFVSVSSTNSSCSDKSSCSASTTSFQGMLQCTWKDGLPHHVFSVDDKNEVYVANLSRVKPSDDKVLDYVYTFHLREKELKLDNIGTMQVSTSVTLCSDDSQIRETRFILSLSSANLRSEPQNHTHKKNKNLTSKVVKVFRSSHLSSKSWGSNTIPEDVHNSVDPDKDYLPSLELAAVIVKDICKNRKEDEIGGWGLKFLKKSGHDEYMRNKQECSKSMEIIIPAGLHGGPKTRAGGPLSLVERWISGGLCDCGGWDIGCALTILSTRSNSGDSSSKQDNSGECKSTDLFVQGSKQDAPMLKIVNIHEGLYYIHFQSTLSTLQSFAIAAAIIHSRSPVFGSKEIV